MGNWFAPPAAKITAHDQAVLDLKIQRDKLRQYSAKASQVIEREKDVAKKLLSQGKKDRALVALRRKRYQETLLKKTEETLINVGEMVDAIEFAVVEKEVVDGLKQGNVVLKKLHAEIGGIEGVEDLLSDTEDAVRQQEEIDIALSRAMTSEDDDAVNEELAALEAMAGAAASDALAGVEPSRAHAQAGAGDAMELDVTAEPEGAAEAVGAGSHAQAEGSRPTKEPTSTRTKRQREAVPA